ncbi:MAG: hypothetical protein ACKO01_12970, partial [Erythrobacter sp.]
DFKGIRNAEQYGEIAHPSFPSLRRGFDSLHPLHNPEITAEIRHSGGGNALTLTHRVSHGLSHDGRHGSDAVCIQPAGARTWPGTAISFAAGPEIISSDGIAGNLQDRDAEERRAVDDVVLHIVAGKRIAAGP